MTEHQKKKDAFGSKTACVDSPVSIKQYHFIFYSSHGVQESEQVVRGLVSTLALFDPDPVLEKTDYCPAVASTISTVMFSRLVLLTWQELPMAMGLACNIHLYTS